MLNERRVRRVFFEYDNDNRVETIVFELSIQGKDLSYKLPARYKNVAQIVYKKTFANLSEAQKDQCHRIAWANIRDWLAAQFALVDIEMVKMEEVFLPYMVNQSGVTLFDTYQSKGFLLGDGR